MSFSTTEMRSLVLHLIRKCEKIGRLLRAKKVENTHVYKLVHKLRWLGDAVAIEVASGLYIEDVVRAIEEVLERNPCGKYEGAIMRSFLGQVCVCAQQRAARLRRMGICPMAMCPPVAVMRFSFTEREGIATLLSLQ